MKCNNPMSLICKDIDNIIASYFFGKNNKWNSKILRKIYYVFGKSTFGQFVIICKNHFLDISYRNFGSDDNIISLLSKIIGKKHPQFYQSYNYFAKRLDNNIITFKSEYKKKSRQIIHYLSFYYGYLCVHTNVTQEEHIGSAYEDVICDFKTVGYDDSPLSYKFLRSKRIHNLKYYDLVEKGKTIWEDTYVLKPNVNLYKKGVTYDVTELKCIKII